MVHGMEQRAIIDRLFSVAGKTVLVTGGTQGLGRMLAAGFLEAGARVVIAARKPADLAATVDELSPVGVIHGLVADVGTADGVSTLAAAVGDLTPRLDVLVNNAGTSWQAPIEDHPRDKFEKVLDLNLVGPYDLTRQLVGLLRAAATPDDPARVINISSAAGIKTPDRHLFGYTASKTGLHMLTRNLAFALAPEIVVNCIAPGFFESRMNAHYFDPDHPAYGTGPQTPLGRPGQADDIVGAALYLAAPASRWVTGVTLPVAGGGGTIGP